MVAFGYAVLALLGVIVFTDLMWIAFVLELLHGHGEKAMVILILIMFFGE